MHSPQRGLFERDSPKPNAGLLPYAAPGKAGDAWNSWVELGPWNGSNPHTALAFCVSVTSRPSFLLLQCRGNLRGAPGKSSRLLGV